MKQTGSPSSWTSSRFWVWVFLPLLGVILLYGLVSLPPPGDTNPTFHVASRYLDRGEGETGFTSSFLAVLLDYRSFDLILLNLFFLALALTILLFCSVENLPIRLRERGCAGAAILSSLILFILGWFGLKNGDNFMDYEFWSGLFDPTARTHGAWITGGLVLLTAASSLMWTWQVWTLRKEKHRGL